MKARRHDPIGGVKCLFDTITMMHVDVDVQDTGMDSEPPSVKAED